MVTYLPNISVVIPTRDRIHTLMMVLSALAAQRYPASYEVVVVDDCSSAPVDSALPLAQFGIDIRVIRNTSVLGDRRSRDRGVDNANHELIILLDNDMIPCRDFLMAHAHAHEDEKQQAQLVITGSYEDIPPKTRFFQPWFSDVRRLYRLRQAAPRAPIRGGSTCANMSMLRDTYNMARKEADSRLFAHPEWEPTYNIYGWKDLEFLTCLDLMDAKMQISFSAWTLHCHRDSVENRLRKALMTGVGRCRYMVLYPEKVAEVMHQYEIEWLTRQEMPPNVDEVLGALAYAKVAFCIERLNMTELAAQLLGKCHGPYQKIGTEVAKRGGFELLRNPLPLDIQYMKTLYAFIRNNRIQVYGKIEQVSKRQICS